MTQRLECVPPDAMLIVGGRSDTYGVLSSVELVRVDEMILFTDLLKQVSYHWLQVSSSRSWLLDAFDLPLSANN